MSLAEDLRHIMRGEVADDAATRAANSEDTSLFRVVPEVVVSPADVADLATLVRYAEEHSIVSLTARAAGTDMSGGPLTDSVVVRFTDHFNHIKHVDAKTAVVEPGVYYRDLERETLRYGSVVPSYTASKELNAVGGMIGNNSAGEKSLTYGKTERWVRELKVMLRDGNEYSFRKLQRAELEAKKALDTLEGQMYRDIDWIIHEKHAMIMAAKPQVSKNSAGYGIWNVWDEAADTFDLTQLFVGSQGTLGLTTEVTFELVQPKPHTRMLVLFLRPKHMAQLGDIINAVLQQQPESFESYDDKTFQVMLRVLPKLFKRLGGNIFKLGRDFLPEMKMVLTGGIPKMVLMAEFAGDDVADIMQRAEAAEKMVRSKFKVATHITNSAAESNKFWIIRRESFALLRENVQHRHTAPFIEDIVVRPEQLSEFLPRLYDILDEYKLLLTIAGHVGDGNFHIIPLMDFSRPDFQQIITELSTRVYDLVGEFDGTITGEHNDGLIRTPFLDRMFSPEMLQVFTDIKRVFDPNNTFNPHKKVNGSMERLQASLKTDASA